MDTDAICRVVEQCHFPDYTFVVTVDPLQSVTLRAFYIEPDVHTGVPERQETRSWVLTRAMSRSQIVQTVFKCVLTSMEHRAREFFQYQGRAVFGPHFDVEALWALADEGR